MEEKIEITPAQKKWLEESVERAKRGGLAGFFGSIKERLEQTNGQYLDQREQLVRKARLIIFIKIEEDNEGYVIDLMPNHNPAGAMYSGLPIDGKQPDVSILFDNRERFIRILNQEEDGKQAYETGKIKVDASLRSIPKLKNLRDAAKQMMEDFKFSVPDGGITMDSLATTQKRASLLESDHEFSKEGYLEKRSEWVKSFNSRYIVLKWNSKDRPLLRYFNSAAAARSGVAPRGEIEIHSSYAVSVSDASKNIISLTDKRQGQTIVLKATSKRNMDEWIEAFQTAIHARQHGATTTTTTSKMTPTIMSSTPMKSQASSSSSSVNWNDLMMATVKLCDAHQLTLQTLIEENKALKKELAAIQIQNQALTSFPISTAFEGDFSALCSYFGWKIIPIASVLAYSFKFLLSSVLSNVNFVQDSSVAILDSLLGKLTTTSQASSNTSYYGPLLGSITLIAFGSCVYKIVDESDYFALFRRRWTVYLLSMQVIYGFKLAHIKSLRMNPLHEKALWEVVQIKYAEKIYAHSLKLRGLWVKTAQFLGARPDILPETFISVLKRLHDAVPPTPFPQVRKTIEEELKRKIDDIFMSIDENALASASIGQVHRAVLRTGEQVVVKVQHPGVRPMIEQDLKNMEVIMKMVEFVDNGPDFRPVLDEWTKEVTKELSFKGETANMLEVGKNLASDPNIRATLPRVLEEFSSEKVLVMRYIEGAKVTDLEQLREIVGVETEEQKARIASEVCHAFGHQLFVDGLFNGDPHPGNLLVARYGSVQDGAVQCLRPIPREDGSVNEDDPVVVLLDFGLTKRLPNDKRLAFSRLLCAVQAVDISGMFIAFKEMGLILKREDPFENLEGMRFAFRETSTNAQARAETMAHIQKIKAKYDEIPIREQNPVEAYPPELMLFFRTVFLLRGLCSQLGVRHPYLRTMSEYAKRAMLERYPKPMISINTKNALERKLLDRVQELVRDGEIVGIQIHVMRNTTESIVNIAHGSIHYLDSRPVTENTLFPCIGISQGIAQILVLKSLAERNVDIRTELVTRFWPEFGNAQAAGIWGSFFTKSSLTRSNSVLQGQSLTVQELISGDSARLPFSPSSLPEKFTSKRMMETSKNLSFIAQEASKGRRLTEHAKLLPWEFSHLAFAWGWSVLGLITPSGLQQSCESLASEKIGFPNEILFSLQSNTISEDQVALLSIDVDRLVGGEGIDLDNLNMESNTNLGNFSKMFESVPALKGREYFLDPRFLGNIDEAKKSINPASNAFVTARSLASLYANVLSESSKSMKQVRETIQSLVLDSSSPEVEPLGERFGISKLQFQSSLKTKEATDPEHIIGFGQVAFGGSCVIAVKDVTIAILLNDLSLTRDVTRILVDDILQDFNLVLNSEI